MRYKGIVAFAGLDHRIVFQGVHMMMASDIGRPWSVGERRESKLVFIGRNLPKDALIGQLGQCLVAAPPASSTIDLKEPR
jgi:G3E family GTPase